MPKLKNSYETILVLFKHSVQMHLLTFFAQGLSPPPENDETMIRSFSLDFSRVSRDPISRSPTLKAFFSSLSSKLARSLDGQWKWALIWEVYRSFSIWPPWLRSSKESAKIPKIRWKFYPRKQANFDLFLSWISTIFCISVPYAQF